MRGPDIIRDPGQLPENNLALIYLVAGVVMLVGGIISHLQTVEAYEQLSDKVDTPNVELSEKGKV